jgi:capsular polysaccharide biosynthesis protein
MFVTGSLRIVHALDAYATPFSFDPDTLTHTGSVYGPDKQRIHLSERIGGHRGGKIVSVSPWKIRPRRFDWSRLEGRNLYLGHWMAHYGHWLLESTSSLWAVDKVDFDRAVFHPFKFGADRLAYMRPFLAAHGIDMDTVVLADRPYQFDYVAIPERSYVPSYSIHQTEFRRPIERVIDFVGRRPSKGRRVFLSRSKLRRRAREPLNRIEVDELAAKLGFEVLHPETRSLEDQISIFQETELLCGFNGSALHNVLFMSGGRVIELGDPGRLKGGPYTQKLCNLAAGADYDFIRYSEAAPGLVDLAQLETRLERCLKSARTRKMTKLKVWQA